MKKAIKAFSIMILLVFGATIIVGLYYYLDYRSEEKNTETPTKTVTFEIAEGETVEAIAADLKESGLIDSELYFKIYVMRAGIADKLQAGAFSIPDNLSMEDLGEILQNARHPDIWVTIPEGLMATEIADYLAEGFATNPESSFKKAQFVKMVTTTEPTLTVDVPLPAGKPLEGYLFPDTYRFPPDATAEFVLHAILENFRIKAYEAHMNDLQNSDYTLYEVITLASILERETKHSDDRPYVADILLRRLESGWALEVDATLLYHFGDWTHEITAEDLEIDTLYNTRKYAGLTPTPIANPGAETISAVLSPTANEYWYYISDLDGDLHYAVTLEEHNANINTYLR